MTDRREFLTGMAVIGLGVTGGAVWAETARVFLVADEPRRAERARREIRETRGDDAHIVSIDAWRQTLHPGQVTARDEIWIACVYDERLHLITRPLREGLPRSIRITLT